MPVNQTPHNNPQFRQPPFPWMSSFPARWPRPLPPAPPPAIPTKR